MVDNKHLVKEAEEVVVVNEDNALQSVSQSIESNTELAISSMDRVQSVVEGSKEELLKAQEELTKSRLENEKLRSNISLLESESSKVTITHQGNYHLDVRTSEDLDDVKESIKKAYAKKIEKLNEQVADLTSSNAELREQDKVQVTAHNDTVRTLNAKHRQEIKNLREENERLDEASAQRETTMAQKYQLDVEKIRMEVRNEQHEHNMNLKKLLLDFNHKVSSVRIGWAARLLGFKDFVKEFQQDLKAKQWRYLSSI